MNKNIQSLLRTATILLGLLVLIFSSTITTNHAIPVTGQTERQANSTVALPAFDVFVAAVTNGDAQNVRGVYVPGVLALRVQQQPSDNAGYVPSVAGLAAQFSFAAQSGITGLIAHNYLAGELFFNLEIDQEVTVVYGDGRMQHYIIRDQQRYQALSPDSPYSDFLDLDTNVRLSSTDLYNRVYTGAHHLTFQTCIENDGILTWGRLFVIAESVDL